VHSTKAEALEMFLALPATLTKASSNIGAVVARFGYDTDWFKASNPSKVYSVPANHPSQNRSKCGQALVRVAAGGEHALYEAEKRQLKGSYIVTIENGFVAQHGYVAAACGFYQQKEGCSGMHNREAERWHAGCHSVMTRLNVSWEDMWRWVRGRQGHSSRSDGDLEQDAAPLAVLRACSNVMLRDTAVVPTAVERVFTANAVWDFNYHHWMADVLAKMVNNLDFLRHNEDVRIQIRGFEREKPGWVNDKGGDRYISAISRFRNRTLELLGISPERLVVGPVIAKTIYVPRSTSCAYALWNPLEVRQLSQVMLAAAALRVTREGTPDAVAYQQLLQLRGRARGDTGEVAKGEIRYSSGRKNLVILHRRSRKRKDSDRDWTDFTFKLLKQALMDFYPFHNIVVMSSDAGHAEQHCFACDLMQLSRADILVGAHGAGLTNQMFMPTGSLIIEIVGTFSNVNLPLCGYYGAYAAIFGHHHYLHTYEFQPFEKRNRTIGGGRIADAGYHPLVGELDELGRRSSSFYKELQVRINWYIVYPETLSNKA